jgi:UDP-3-O-[3-hydroxymyristoyl] glucosamine N-acyltransferase
LYNKGVTGDTTLVKVPKLTIKYIGHAVIGKNVWLLHKQELQVVIIEDEVTIWGQVGTTSG